MTSAKGDSLSFINPGVGDVDAANTTTCSGAFDLKEGDKYAVCATVSSKDGTTGSTDVPLNNRQDDYIYDACGNLYAHGTMYNWSGSNGWFYSPLVIGYAHTVYEPAEACAGNFTAVDYFRATFSDGVTLTASASTQYMSVMLSHQGSGSGSETQGGGNPGENDCHTCDGDPVDTATGDYAETETDMTIPGRGPGLTMERTYSSLAAAAGTSSPLGYGWAQPYNMTLAVTATSATVTNGNGSKTVFTPNSNGGYNKPPRVLATLVKNTDGTYTYTVRKREIYNFSSAGKLTSIADLNGEKTTLGYDASGRLQSATDGASRKLTFSYDAAGWMNGVTDSSGRSITYGHDADGNLTEVTDVRGGHWSYGYDSGHLLLTRTDARRNTVMTNAYDATGRVLAQDDALGKRTGFEYTQDSANPKLTSTQVTSPNGNATRYAYTGGVLTTMTRAVGTAQSATWTYEHDPSTLGITKVTDPNDHVAQAGFDAQGNQTWSQSPLGRRTTSAYDSLNDLVYYTDASGVQTTYTYDAKGNRLTSSTPLTGTTSVQKVTYTHGTTAHLGDVTAITDPNAKKTSFTYDTYGNVATVTDPLSHKTTYTYDSLGRRKTKLSPRGFTTTYTYDDAGNLLTTTDPLTHVIKQSWDPDGNLATSTDGKENQTTYTYDANNRRTTTTRADQTTLQSAYDDDGNQVSSSDGAGNTTTYSYDALDQRVSQTDPLNRTTSYTYDPAGNLAYVTDAMGRTTSLAYDADDRLTGVSYSDGQTPNVSYGYDANSRRTSMQDGTGASSYVYDSLGRMTKTTNGSGATTSFTYDLANHQTSTIYPNGKKVTRTFDAAGRMLTVLDWLNGKTTFTYDANSNLTKATLPHNADAYTYNNADQLTNIAITATPVASVAYTRDANGAVASATPAGLPGGAVAYGYNSLNELTQAGAASYAYDAAKNPTTLAGVSGFAYDAGNQLTQAAVATYSYDALGERTQTAPTAAAATTYGWNQAGELVSTSGTTTANYTYDGEGLRAAKTTGTSTARYVWDPSDGLSELLSDGTNNYIYGPDGVPLEQISASGTVTYMHHDALGSIRLLTNASGAVVGSVSYDAYGNRAGSTGTVTTPFGFAGEYTDAETGLQYLRARYYDPQTGQFISRDPLEAITGDAYGYAGRDPVNETDPTGLLSFGQVLNALNPIHYYKAEIRAWRSGCSYWQSVKHGLMGAGVAAADVAGAAGVLRGLAVGAAEGAAEGASVGFRADTTHIFRNAAGHLAADTAENRALIQSAVDSQNLRQTITLSDGSTLAKYYKTLPDGTQVWAEVRNGNEITNGGLNATPR